MEAPNITTSASLGVTSRKKYIFSKGSSEATWFLPNSIQEEMSHYTATCSKISSRFHHGKAHNPQSTNHSSVLEERPHCKASLSKFFPFPLKELLETRPYWRSNLTHEAATLLKFSPFQSRHRNPPILRIELYSWTAMWIPRGFRHGINQSSVGPGGTVTSRMITFKILSLYIKELLETNL